MKRGDGEEADGLPPLKNLALTPEAWDYLVAAEWGMSVEELRKRPKHVVAEYHLMYRVKQKIESARRSADAASMAGEMAKGLMP